MHDGYLLSEVRRLVLSPLHPSNSATPGMCLEGGGRCRGSPAPLSPERAHTHAPAPAATNDSAHTSGLASQCHHPFRPPAHKAPPAPAPGGWRCTPGNVSARLDEFAGVEADTTRLEVVDPRGGEVLATAVAAKHTLTWTPLLSRTRTDDVLVATGEYDPLRVTA